MYSNKDLKLYLYMHVHRVYKLMKVIVIVVGV